MKLEASVCVIIRSANAEDIAAMMKLEKRAATAGHWSREQYEKALNPEPSGRQSLVLIVEFESAVAGFLAARAVGAEWEIENVVVAGPAQRRGLGARLVREFLDRARSQGAASVFLEVRESNWAARMLYEKWAFVESGRRKRYYRDPDEDAILYRLEAG